MKPLVIFGCGGAGRELLGWIAASSETFRNRWKVDYFVSDDAVPGQTCNGLPVLRRTDFKSPPRYLLAVGSVPHRRRLSQELAKSGWESATWIHETALVGTNVEVGEGSLIFPYDSVAANTRIGRFVFSNGRNILGHDVRIGDYCVLLGRAWIGGDVTIDSDVLVGAAAIVHPRLHVGTGATLGIGSVVVRNVPNGATVFGNPAKQLAGSGPSVAS